MISKRLVSIAVLSALPFTAQASELDLSLSKDSAAAEFSTNTNVINNSGAKVTIGGIYNEDEDKLGFAGLSVSGVPAANQQLHVGLGGRFYYGKFDQPDKSVSALALGGSGRVNLPLTVPVALAADIWYAPEITTFSDGDDLLDMRARVETEILPNATAFVGYRKVRAGLQGVPARDFEDGLHVGIRLNF